jgi:small redox-active disulfide protein 2
MVKLQVLGTGCAKCIALGEHAAAAAQSLGLDYELEKVTDINRIIEAGVTRTPALAVNGAVMTSGKLLSVDDIKKLLSA